MLVFGGGVNISGLFPTSKVKPRRTHKKNQEDMRLYVKADVL